MKVTRTSPLTGKENTQDLPITKEQMADWESGRVRYIQNAFPNLTAAQREFILTGSTEDDWERMFGTEDDE
jgi:hypothetical protein